MAVWYNNLPDETQYFKAPQMGFYMGFLYLFLFAFLLFVISGIIYLVKNTVHKIVVYVLIPDLVLTSYCVWVYSVNFKNIRTPGFMLFVTLALFMLSIFNFTSESLFKRKA